MVRKKGNVPLVVSPGFFLGSLLLVGCVALFGCLALPFVVIVMVYGFLFYKTYEDGI